MAFTWNSTRVAKVWKDTRAHENAIVEPEELPTIDAKWLRKNCGTVLQMFKLLFIHSSWSSSTASGQIYIAGAWKHFAKSLGDAASKEVKASSETVQACAQVVRFVQELWKEGPRAVNARGGEIETVTDRLSFLLRVVIAELGAAPFIDVIDNKTVCLPAVLLQTFALTAVEMKSGHHEAETRLGGAYLPAKLGTATLLLLEKTLYHLDKRLHDAYRTSNFDQQELNGALELVSACLHDASGDVRILTLQKMQASLRIWLEDPERSSTSHQIEKFARTDTANGFAGVVIPSLGSLPHSMIESLDELFAAGFRSTHKDTINQMVEMWNTTHGQASQTAYGPSLTTALTRLRPYVDVELVNFPLSGDLHLPEPNASNAPPAFLDFVESQSQLAITEGTEKNDGNPDRALHRTQANGCSSPQEASEVIPTSRPQSSHSTPRRSRRHNDSQVQFQQIDSSPLNITQAESQYLTERQKEVRDRQRQDASVYFSDLRPDIAPKLPHNTMSSSELGRRALMEKQRPSTPTLPDRGLADFDNNPTASPTPRSKHQALRLEDIDAPSSPLSLQADEDVIAQESMAFEGSSEAGLEDDHEISAKEEEEGSEARSIELQQDDPMHQGTLDKDDEETHPTGLAILGNEMVQTPSGLVEDLPKVAAPEREYDAEANSVTHEEHEAAVSGVHSRPADPRTRIDSDEFDMMSQSQLSQDLESHISEHGDISERVLTLEEEEEELHQTPTNSSATTASRKKRKRGQSSYAGSKRRKSRSLSRSLSIASEEEREVVYDCIEIDTSSRPEVLEVRALRRRSHVEVFSQRAASEGKVGKETVQASTGTGTDDSMTDAHRMPPPILPALGLAAAHNVLSEDIQQSFDANIKPSFNSLTPADKSASSSSEVELAIAEVVETILERKQGGSVPIALPLAATKNSRPMTTFGSSSEVAAGTTELAVRTAEEVAVQTLSPPQQHVSVQAETDIMTTLQHVLERLKQSSGEGLDLRTIDDLCFQIRTEGQNATTRWASH
jgi:hypothetical protein